MRRAKRKEKQLDARIPARNGAEVGGQKDRGQRSEVRSQKAEGSRQKAGKKTSDALGLMSNE